MNCFHFWINLSAWRHLRSLTFVTIYRPMGLSSDNGQITDDSTTRGPTTEPTALDQVGTELHCNHTSVSAFKSRWIKVLDKFGVPESDWSVKWITEHVQKIVHAEPSHKADVLSWQQRNVANSMLCQRIRRIPVQYIIGEWDFRNVTLSMKPPVFIPEPETEELVGLVLNDCCSFSDKPLTFLDLCCGSGAIAVSLLAECPRLKGYALDLSMEAVLLTQENAVRNGVSDRLTVLQGSVEDGDQLMGAMSQKMGKFDFIVSNPPYIPSREMESVQYEVHRYIDHRALDGGEDGLDLTNKILSICRHLLKPNGYIWLELDLEHVNDIHDLVGSNKKWELRYNSVHRDYTGRYRFHKLVRI